jgi:tetratricopeptide (TPR) repeat protein
MNSNEQQILKKIEQARKAYQGKNYQKSIELYRWIEEQIQDDPVNLPIIWIELGWSYYNLRDFKNCILYLDKSLASDLLTTRQQFDCLRLIGFSYGALKDSKNALRYLEKALKKELPESEKKYVHFEVGKIYFLTGAFKRAKTSMDTAARFFSWEDAAYFQAIRYYQGFIAFYEKQYDCADSLFTEIIENATGNKNKATGYFGRAHLLYERKNYSELIDVCKKIVAMDKNFYDGETITFFLCRAFMELNQLEDLTAGYNELRRKHPNGRYQSYYLAFEKELDKNNQN